MVMTFVSHIDKSLIYSVMAVYFVVLQRDLLRVQSQPLITFTPLQRICRVSSAQASVTKLILSGIGRSTPIRLITPCNFLGSETLLVGGHKGGTGQNSLLEGSVIVMRAWPAWIICNKSSFRILYALADLSLKAFGPFFKSQYVRLVG